MEITLAIVVVASVILFGALISIGNERQKKAIDNLREQVVLWAVQDLRVKREHLAQMVQVSDPLGWLNNIASKVCGFDLKLQIHEAVEEPKSIICTSAEINKMVVFSPIPPVEAYLRNRGKRNKLVKFLEKNPFLSLPRRMSYYKISVLNGGIFFDIEFPIVWKKLTGQELEQSNFVWMYLEK